MSFFEFPLSLILALALVLCTVVLHKCSAGRYLSCRVLSLILLLSSSVLIAVEGTWSPGLPRHWTFIAVILLGLLSLGLTSLKDFSNSSIYAFLSHSGLGQLLDLGCKGMLGGSNLASDAGGHPRPEEEAETHICSNGLPCNADDVVWRELPSFVRAEPPHL